MTELEILEVVNKQREFFKEKKTYDVDFRITYLKKLRLAIYKNLNDIYEALKKDLNKCPEEAYMCEVGIVLSEISYAIKHVKKFAKPKKRRTPLFQAIASSYQIATPYGNVLVMSPWNYPFLLSLDPLVEAISAGNTVLLKASQYSPHTSKVLANIIEESFPEEYAKVIYGGHKENEILINQKWDYVFFTGGKTVGGLVYETQSKFQTPVTLELGGKSPVIVDKNVNLKYCARRLAWGKIINSGQTCVAPDYCFVHESVHDEFIKLLKIEFAKRASDAFNNERYCKMINEKHFNRAIKLIDQDKVVYGGKYSLEKLKIEPTILDDVIFNDPVMQEEIFAPILPIIKYQDIKTCLDYIDSHDTPLAFYVFSKNKRFVKQVLSHIEFGGGCVNDVVMHLATTELPFGGFKESGMGHYHGKFGFDTFSHYKSILNKSTLIDMPMRYKPENKLFDYLIKKFLK